MLAHLGPNLQFPCREAIVRSARGGRDYGAHTFAKYLQMFSAAAPRS